MWIVNLFDSLFFPHSLSFSALSWIQHTGQLFCTIISQFLVWENTPFVCVCVQLRVSIHQDSVEHIFAAIHRWNTEHTKYQAHISMIYYFFPHLFFISFFIHLKWAGRFHSKNILLLLRAVVFSWKSFVVFVVRSCYHFATFIN